MTPNVCNNWHQRRNLLLSFLFQPTHLSPYIFKGRISRRQQTKEEKEENQLTQQQWIPGICPAAVHQVQQLQQAAEIYLLLSLSNYMQMN